MNEKEIFKRGLNDRMNGKSADDNPFNPKSEERKHTHWLSGWLIGNYKVNSEASDLEENGT